VFLSVQDPMIQMAWAPYVAKDAFVRLAGNTSITRLPVPHAHV
jgi:hypothetical protein